MKIAILDDSPIMRSMICMTLAKANFPCVTFDSPLKAVKEIDTSFSLVLTDFNMPEMNGLEVIRALKLKFPTLPIVMLTTEGKIHKQALEAGADGFITKPFHPSQLVTFIKSAH